MEVLISAYAIFAWTHLLFIGCTYFHLSHIVFFFFNFTGHQNGNTMLYPYKIIPIMEFYMSVPPLLWRRVLILSKMKEGMQCFKLLLWCMTLRLWLFLSLKFSSQVLKNHVMIYLLNWCLHHKNDEGMPCLKKTFYVTRSVNAKN